MTARCCYCGRSPATCWVMPCLELERDLAHGAHALKTWARRSGVVLVRRKER